LFLLPGEEICKRGVSNVNQTQTNFDIILISPSAGKFTYYLRPTTGSSPRIQEIVGQIKGMTKKANKIMDNLTQFEDKLYALDEEKEKEIEE